LRLIEIGAAECFVLATRGMTPKAASLLSFVSCLVVAFGCEAPDPGAITPEAFMGPAEAPPVAEGGAASSPPDAEEPRPWLEALPAPTRTFYVSPTGTGDGSTDQTPMRLTAAVAQAAAGDLYWLLGGRYPGLFVLGKDGTKAAPIVFRARPGAHAEIVGGIHVLGDYTWVWGVEVRDPNATVEGGGVTMNARGAHLINSVIHDTRYASSTLAAWNKPEQIIYGNIIYAGHHGIYNQNDFKAGMQYLVANVVMDALPRADGTNGPFELHTYAEGGHVSGVHLESNVFYNTTLDGGSVLLGGKNDTPNDHYVVTRNYFHNVSMRIGYARPAQATFTKNFMARSALRAGMLWGAGEAKSPGSPPSVFTDNEIYWPRSRSVILSTAAYVDKSTGTCVPTAAEPFCRAEGSPKLRAEDSWDRNVYGPSFSATFFAGGVQKDGADFVAWKELTAAAGNAFDVHSSVVAGPTGFKVAVVKNDYEKGRAHLVIYNFAYATAPSVPVDLSGVIAKGTPFALRNVKDAFGAPLLKGTYDGASITVPAPSELNVYLVTDSER
jgi:hypothetical protein